MLAIGGLERESEGGVQADLMVESEVEGDVGGGVEFCLTRIRGIVVVGVGAGSEPVSA